MYLFPGSQLCFVPTAVFWIKISSCYVLLCDRLLLHRSCYSEEMCYTRVLEVACNKGNVVVEANQPSG